MEFWPRTNHSTDWVAFRTIEARLARKVVSAARRRLREAPAKMESPQKRAESGNSAEVVCRFGDSAADIKCSMHNDARAPMRRTKLNTAERLAIQSQSIEREAKWSEERGQGEDELRWTNYNRVTEANGRDHKGRFATDDRSVILIEPSARALDELTVILMRLPQVSNGLAKTLITINN
jgi:hypothetical protein